VDHLEDKFRDQITLAYIYFDYKDKETHYVKNIAENILKQLVAKLVEKIPSALLEAFENCRKDPRHFKTLKELQVWIHRCVKCSPQVILVLDALDECGNQSTQRSIATFLLEIMDGGSVKIFLTSRLEVPGVMGTVPIIEIRAKDADIDIFVQRKLVEAQCDSETELSSELKREVVRTIRSNAKGM
jgi:hypothetical protein